MIVDVLHGAAIASTAVGACCVAAERRAWHARVRDAVSASAMTLAMACAVLGGPGVGVWCAAAMLVLALGMLPFARRAPSAERQMVAYDALGAVLMAALMVVMGTPAAPSSPAHHGVAPQTLAALLVVAVLVYVIASAAMAVRTPGRIARLRPIAMGGSVLLMALAALV